MPWWWILVIVSAIVGPFEAMYTLNKAWKKRKQQQKQAEEERPENRDMSGGNPE